MALVLGGGGELGRQVWHSLPGKYSNGFKVGRKWQLLANTSGSWKLPSTTNKDYTFSYLKTQKQIFFSKFPFYFQSVSIHSANLL
jgi:hypothetical protein